MQNDTIVAIATPPGRGGIGVVRVSGPRARDLAVALLEHRGPLEPRLATFARLVIPETGAIDHAIATFFPAPGSYTGEDVLEISAHGSPVLLNEIVSAAIRGGARMAGRGEFTLRAFLNGRLDLVQAEAVGDLIAATTPLQARAAFDQLEGTLTTRIAAIDAQLLELVVRLEASLDFPEEGYRFLDGDEAVQRIDAVAASLATLVHDGRRGRLIREGMTVAIVGRPNVGKSSVFNRLAGAERAIVHDIAGTTRDLVSETVDINGIEVTLVDTAGLRDATEAVEAEGVKRAAHSARAADLVLAVFDASQPLTEEDRGVMARTSSRPRLCVLNKADLPAAWPPSSLGADRDPRAVSARDGLGFDALRASIAAAAGLADPRERAAVTNLRHLALLERAAGALGRARASAHARAYEELVLADLHDARAALEEITGRRSAEDLLDEIFGKFCIGK
jgi:tRNA modification GTPase